MILPGYGALNATLPVAARALEERQEQALAGQELPLQAAEQATLHPRVHLDAVGHVGHGARLGAHFVARCHGEHDRLHVIPDNLVRKHGMNCNCRIAGCAIDGSAAPVGRCPKSATACGAWAAGPDPTTTSRCRRSSARSRLGCNFFDTAWVYGEGKSEKLLGEALHRRKAHGGTAVVHRDEDSAEEHGNGRARPNIASRIRILRITFANTRRRASKISGCRRSTFSSFTSGATAGPPTTTGSARSTISSARSWCGHSASA